MRLRSAILACVAATLPLGGCGSCSSSSSGDEEAPPAKASAPSPPSASAEEPADEGIVIVENWFEEFRSSGGR